MSMKRVSDIEIDQDLKHQQREWVAERVGWALMAVLLAAGLSGLLGHGPLSNATAGERGSLLWVEYHRFERYQAPAELKVHLRAVLGQGGTLRVWIDGQYLQGMEVQHVEPTPDSVEVAADRMTYTFRTSAPDQPTVVVYRMQAGQYGPLRARLGVEGGPQLQFSQFIYP
jgi:hypothetical protein